MNISEVIVKYSIWIALVVIVLFLFYQFYLKPKLEKQNSTDDKKKDNPSPQDSKESTVTRMGRGFKTMNEKIRNSDYVKGMQKEQSTAKWNDFLPEGLSTQSSNEEDVWSTDLRKLGKAKL